MIILKNLAESFITSAISETATEITIPADHADLFPNLLGGDHFRCALVNPATVATEFINVTGRNGNVLTVSRGEESVAALPFPVESRIHLRMTAKTWEEMAEECWMRPKDQGGEVAIPQYIDSSHFSLAGDYRDFFKTNRAIKAYPNLSIGFVESVMFAENVTTVKVIEMTVPDPLSHIEAGLDPDALAKRTLSNEELLGYMTPVPVIAMEALEVDGGTLVNGTISHPEPQKSYPDSTEFHFVLPDNVTDFERTGQSFKMRVPIVTEENSPQAIGPISCRAAQMSLILSDPSNPITLSVRYVGISVGVTLAYADTQEGYPGADVNSDGAKLPACTTGLNNPSGKSLLSGRPEFEITGAELTILEGTTKDVLKTSSPVTVGRDLFFDNGEGVSEESSTEESSTVVDFFGDGSGVDLWTFNDTMASVNGVTTIPAAGLTAYEPMKFGKGVKLNDGAATKFNPVPTVAGKVFTVSWFVPNVSGSRTTFSFTANNVQQTVYIDLTSSTISWKGNGQLPDYLTITRPDSELVPFIHFVLEVTATSVKRYIHGVLEGDNVVDYSAGAITLWGPESNTGSVPIYFDQLRWFNRTVTAEEVILLRDELELYYATVITALALPAAPTKAFMKPVVGATIGTGATDEPINPETVLTLGEGSTTSSIVLTSDTSIKDKIYTDGSIHKKIKCDGQVVAVESVSEEVSSIPSSPSLAEQSIIADQGTYFYSSRSGTNVTGNPFTALSTETGSLQFYADQVEPGALNVDYLGVNFGSSQVVTGLEIKNYSSSSHIVSQIMIQKSADGVVWVDVQLFDIPTAAKIYKLVFESAHEEKQWRILAKANTNGGTAYGWVIPYARWTTEILPPANLYKTTVNLTTPLAQIPTTVALADCFSLPSAIESCVINGSALKFTGTKVDISDPAVKRLALKLVGADSLRVKAAKIYTEEGA
ncbi:hypothetical protein [Maridesulfovibrio ferrireducens]|uniref:hypothetical protein n=1 Tax=Maridesulfovibrio ferrireducens TaxID=246191 RepID=UPI001A2D64D4|nr:hypothetical protein [Maridesulfovibrio ferrireducens]MBI9110317.1 hypothetical protein [Maridesulfovibrio ferrireducens]